MTRLDLAFEHRILKQLRRLPHRPKRWLLAISGGLDSMVLAEFCLRWRRGLDCELGVAHVHHGLSGSLSQGQYRDKAQLHVRDWALEKGIGFFSNEAENIELTSEGELRAYREEHLNRWLKEHAFNCIVYAHHRDDLVETRLLRLIRGTGRQGLSAMLPVKQLKLRPLLSVSRLEIRAYAMVCSLSWIEDPSNQDASSLRNWIRNSWLPALEARQPGATNALARSLALLSTPPKRKCVDVHVGLRRDLIKASSFPEQERMVAEYLHALGFDGYAQTHIHEILKRIDTRRKNLTFKMLGADFELTPDFLRASRV